MVIWMKLSSAGFVIEMGHREICESFAIIASRLIASSHHFSQMPRKCRADLQISQAILQFV